LQPIVKHALPEAADVSHERNLAACLGNLANLYLETGHSAKGIAAYHQAYEVQERLVAARPSDTVAALQLAQTQLNLGMLELDAGK
jgi:hypothetical protein